MAEYYIYLISSLPILIFGNKPPFSSAKFIELCQGFIPEQEFIMLDAIVKGRESLYANQQPTLLKWLDFDRGLRNELVKIRASRKKIDPLKYLRPEGFVDPSITHLAQNAHRNPSLLEAEKILDQERWRVLEECAIGHYFDLDYLIAYAYKLLILERWDDINSADTANLLEAALTKELA